MSEGGSLIRRQFFQNRGRIGLHVFCFFLSVILVCNRNSHIISPWWWNYEHFLMTKNGSWSDTTHAEKDSPLPCAFVFPLAVIVCLIVVDSITLRNSPRNILITRTYRWICHHALTLYDCGYFAEVGTLVFLSAAI